MEFDFEPLTLGLFGVFYILILVVIWVFNALMFTWNMPVRTKILLSIIMLPMTYMMIVWQKNR